MRYCTQIMGPGDYGPGSPRKGRSGPETPRLPLLLAVRPLSAGNKHLVAHGVLQEQVTEQLTRRDALVAALAVTALGGQALARPRLARAAAVTNIGVILPLSKPADSVAGTNILNSARLWVEWVNSTGGVGGQHVAIKAYDSHAEPNRAVASLVRAVTKDGCVVILGGWDSPVATAEITAAHKQSVPMFVAYAWSQNITEANYPEVVRIGPNNDILSNAFAPFMQKRGYTQIGLLAEDTAFGQGEGGAIRATATLANIDVMAQTYKR